MNHVITSAEDGLHRPSPVAVGALVVMRLMLAAWVGAAVLFVLTSVAEQMFTEFNSTVRDQLATIRFPLYYATGITCCTLTLAAGVLCRSLSRRLTAALVLATLAGIVFGLDYWFVYRPLQELIIPAGQPRTEQFTQLHTWSRNVNALHLLLVLTAAVQAALPLTCGKR
ncbi:MAG: hypothetical protein ABGZ35_19790 [Planctomycetaceae bacterium]|jgi:hypothetical protein